MRKKTMFASLLLIAFALAGCKSIQGKEQERRISVEEYRDKMAGGWIGQMVGVGWGAPTEFKFNGIMIPEDKVPVWKPAMVNQYKQDDLYTEMTSLRSLELHGFDVSIRQAGIDFANSGFIGAHANWHARRNLREGIAPPDSGHPQFNAHADDIDYQINADYSGLIAPGMPNVGIELGEKFGRLKNYGDGLYGGQFVAGMYAEAFFEDNPKKLVEAGLACIPAGSQYAEAIRDVIQWHAESPDDWQAAWKKIDAKYQRNKDYRRFSCGNEWTATVTLDSGLNIDAKINGAYIVMGLLYGEGNIEKTIVISMRCGADSDCNPSSAAGILCTAIGMKNLPPRFTSALDRSIKFNYAPYDFDMLLDVCEKLVRQAVAQQGGRIEKDAVGKDVFVIPVRAPKPSALEQCWEPGPIANSRFTAAEMAQITMLPPKEELIRDFERFASGWTIEGCALDNSTGIRERNREITFFATLPANRETPCVMRKRVDIPNGKKTTLELSVHSFRLGNWDLIVRVDGHDLLRKTIENRQFMKVSVDLSGYAGQTINLELCNQAAGRGSGHASWEKIAIESK